MTVTAARCPSSSQSTVDRSPTTRRVLNAADDAGTRIPVAERQPGLQSVPWAHLVSDLVNLNPPAGGGLDNVTDADSGAVTGIALTGTNNADGTWYYSTQQRRQLDRRRQRVERAGTPARSQRRHTALFPGQREFQRQRDRRRYVPRLGPDDRYRGH